VSELVAGVSELVAGVSELVAGVSELVAGVSELVAGFMATIIFVINQYEWGYAGMHTRMFRSVWREKLHFCMSESFV
jgi:X-X-X-Leu-X-X-Gly heptad repeat protein